MGGKDPLQDFGARSYAGAISSWILKLASEFANEPNFLHRY